jgi:putative MATE family efflux protein
MLNFEIKKNEILEGKISRVILLLAGPIMLNNFIQTIYNLTDTFWVSKLGSTHMAAITMIWPIIFFLIATGMGINIAGTSLISQYFGARKKEDSKKVSGQILSFSFLFSLLISIAGIIFTPMILRIMGGKGQLLSYAIIYLRIMFAGLPTIFLFLAFSAIKQGQGDTVTPMKYSVISAALNIILDPIFIYTMGLGISGAALATVLSRGIISIFAIYRLFIRNEVNINKEDLYFNKKILSKILKIGLPSSIGQSTEALGFIILTSFILDFGSNTLAAFGIGNRINSLILMPAMGIGNALATIVGQNLGANQIKRAKKAVKISAILTTGFLITGGIILYPLIPTIIKSFTSDSQVITQGIYYLKLITLSLFLMGFFQIFVGTFHGSGHTIYAMIMLMGRLWVLRIPMIIIFKNYSNLGSNSVWYAMVISNAIISTLGFIFYISGKWQKKVIKDTLEIPRNEIYSSSSTLSR